MRRRAGLALIGLAALLGAAGCGSGGSTAGPAHAGSRSLIDCQNVAQARPREFVLACADGGEVLTHMRWSSWQATARGTGVERVNDCRPNCAGGRFQNFPVQVTLSGAAPIPPGLNVRAGDYYTTMTLHYTGRRPLVYSRDGKATPGPSTRTIQLWSPSSG